MSKSFLLNIVLGNEAMLTGNDVAEALESVVTTLRHSTPGRLDFDGAHKIYDDSGNSVGFWSVQGRD